MTYYAEIEGHLCRGEAHRTLPELCRSILDDIAAGRRELRAIRHPLGFYCFPVHRDGDDGVCVHAWSGELRPAESITSGVHSHSWDLTSFVLYGVLGNAVMRITDAPDTGTHQVFEVHSRGDVDELRATPRLVRWTERERHIARRGEVYRLPAGAFHASVPGDDAEAATLVLGRVRPAADLILGRPGTASFTMPRQRCGAAESVRVASSILSRLSTRE